VCSLAARSPFLISFGKLSGTRGAVGFTVTPAAPIRELRAALHAATVTRVVTAARPSFQQ
jgi:hypothetical protein